MRNQEKLEQVIENNKGQIVGSGYIDIIIKREFVENFVNEIISNDFKITHITWWDYCEDVNSKKIYWNGRTNK